MNLHNTLRLLYNFKHDRKIFCNTLKTYTLYSNITQIDFRRNLSNHNEVLQRTMNSNMLVFNRQINFCTKYNSHLSQNIHTLGKYWSSNSLLLPKNSPPLQNNFSVNSVRNYTDFRDVDVALPHVFNNGIVKTICESPFIQFLMDQMIWVHSYTDLSWCSTIFLVALTARIVVFPLTLLQQRNIAKLHNLSEELRDLNDKVHLKIMREVEAGRLFNMDAPRKYKSIMNEEYHKIIVRENCHPLRSHVAAFLQLPIWVGITFALRNMCCMAPTYDDTAFEIFRQLASGGFAWFPNLIQCDSYWALPVLLGITNLATLEINHMMLSSKEVTRVQKAIKNIGRLFIIVIVPLVTYMPSAVVFYWLTNSSLTLAQTLLLLSPKCRRLMNIPKTDMEIQNPYKYIVERIRNRLLLRSKKNIR